MLTTKSAAIPTFFSIRLHDTIRVTVSRAAAAVAYVASKGINANRMVAIGYGESRLKIAKAKTEAQHQANRRTTVKITANTTSSTKVAVKSGKENKQLARRK